MVVVRLELLYVDGCPGHEALRAGVRALLTRLGVDAPLQERRVETDTDAQRERFLGSPTLRVNGVDVDPDAAERTDYGLKCRLYRTGDGLAAAPLDDWVLAALQRAVRSAGS